MESGACAFTLSARCLRAHPTEVAGSTWTAPGQRGTAPWTTAPQDPTDHPKFPTVWCGGRCPATAVGETPKSAITTASQARMPIAGARDPPMVTGMLPEPGDFTGATADRRAED